MESQLNSWKLELLLSRLIMAARIAPVSILLKSVSEERGFLDEWEKMASKIQLLSNNSLLITWLNLHLVLNFTRLLSLTSCYIFAWLQTQNLRCKQSLAYKISQVYGFQSNQTWPHMLKPVPSRPGIVSIVTVTEVTHALPCQEVSLVLYLFFLSV